MTSEERDRDDLRSTIDAIDADATRLAAVEDEKQDLDPDDPRMRELSEDAVHLARRIEQATLEERNLVNGHGDSRPPRRPH
jgi:hypothetical protein